MENNIAEDALMPISDKLVALAELFECGVASPKGLDETGFAGVSKLLLLIDKEIGTICEGLDKKICSMRQVDS